MEAVHELPDHVDVSGPRPVVRGTDIKVSLIASEYEHLGMSPDEIVEAHPHLTLAAVHAALAFYYGHPEAIQREWQEADSLVSELVREYPSRIARRAKKD